MQIYVEDMHDFVDMTCRKNEIEPNTVKEENRAPK